jgi:hypothetical protein
VYKEVSQFWEPLIVFLKVEKYKREAYIRIEEASQLLEPLMVFLKVQTHRRKACTSI